MRIYWRFSSFFDHFTGIAVAVLFVIAGPAFGITLIHLEPTEITALAREWFGAISSLFGLAAATIAFVFAVIDRAEFKPLSASTTRLQFWGVFKSFLTTLSVATIWAAALAILPSDVAGWKSTQFATTYLTTIVLILLTKFTWTLNQIISVRARH